MTQKITFGQDYKPQFSGHETFPLRMGWLEKAFEAVDAANLCDDKNLNTQNIFLDNKAIAYFGVGKNMVKAIRFWAESAGVISGVIADQCPKTKSKSLDTTDFGQQLLRADGFDPYLESPASLWRIHWNIASNPKNTTAYWLFNIFNDPNFDREVILQRLHAFIVEQGWRMPQDKTLMNDINVLIANYVPADVKRAQNWGPSEESLSSPLTELGLIRRRSNGKYGLNWGPKPSLSNGVFLYAVCDFWQRRSSANTLNIQSLLLEQGAPGRVFLLDESEMVDRLASVSDLTNGLIVWSETAGLKQLIRNKAFPVDFMANLWISDGPKMEAAHAA